MKYIVVINRKTTKFESNSQRNTLDCRLKNCCYQSQNYKIWKQFTTNRIEILARKLLLSIAKLQNLKAIHNITSYQRTKRKVVINRKTTKFESNSQHDLGIKFTDFCCYQSQNYKIWKQFTTRPYIKSSGILLLSIAKLQNLKAIHNQGITWMKK